MLIMSIWSNVSFEADVPFLIFCFDDLSMAVNGVFRSATIIVFLSVYFSSSISSCFVYFGTPTLGTYILVTVMSS